MFAFTTPKFLLIPSVHNRAIYGEKKHFHMCKLASSLPPSSPAPLKSASRSPAKPTNGIRTEAFLAGATAGLLSLQLRAGPSRLPPSVISTPAWRCHLAPRPGARGPSPAAPLGQALLPPGPPVWLLRRAEPCRMTPRSRAPPRLAHPASLAVGGSAGCQLAACSEPSLGSGRAQPGQPGLQDRPSPPRLHSGSWSQAQPLLPGCSSPAPDSASQPCAGSLAFTGSLRGSRKQQKAGLALFLLKRTGSGNREQRMSLGCRTAWVREEGGRTDPPLSV